MIACDVLAAVPALAADNKMKLNEGMRATLGKLIRGHGFNCPAAKMGFR